MTGAFDAPMDFGIFNLMRQRGAKVTSAELVDDAIRHTRIAESLGFARAWFAEHHFSNYSLCPSPLMMVAHAAAVTEHSARNRGGRGSAAHAGASAGRDRARRFAFGRPARPRHRHRHRHRLPALQHPVRRSGDGGGSGNATRNPASHARSVPSRPPTSPSTRSRSDSRRGPQPVTTRRCPRVEPGYVSG